MRRRNTALQRKQLTWLCCSIFMIAGLLFGVVQLDRWIRPDVLAVCAQECQSAASVQIGESIHKVLQETDSQYTDFAVLLYDTDGAVTAVETKTTQINRMQAQLLTQINQDLQAARAETFPVSLGTATGIWLFAGKGPTQQRYSSSVSWNLLASIKPAIPFVQTLPLHCRQLHPFTELQQLHSFPIS